jgi:endonuclease-3 related protein
MSPSTRSPVLTGWRRIPGPPHDAVKARLLRLHVGLLRRFGPQRGWPRRRPYEIAVGVIRAQSTARTDAARCVRAFTAWLLRRCHGRFDRLRRAPLSPLRAEMLAIPGLDPETVDAILLHAAHRPIAVADASTRRLLARHRLIRANADYETTRAFLEAHLPSDPALLSELHALVVAAGKAARR